VTDVAFTFNFVYSTLKKRGRGRSATICDLYYMQLYGSDVFVPAWEKCDNAHLGEG
jgi:hypothetical protein